MNEYLKVKLYGWGGEVEPDVEKKKKEIICKK